MKKVKIGFIGYGYWGKNILRNLCAIKDVEVIAVCDANLGNLEKAKNVVLASKKYDAKLIVTAQFDHLLADKDIDAIVIATPPQTHYKLGIQALKAGKHVFIEKPMTTNRQEAIDLVNAGIIHQKQVMVGHTFLYHPVINDIKKLIDSGELGKIYYLDLVWTNLGKYQKDNILWDLGPHGLSIVEYLMGEILSIKLNSISAIQADLLDVAYLTAYLPNNGFANIHISWLNPNKQRKLTIVGSRKMVVFDDLNTLEPLRIYDKGVEQSKSTSSWGESMMSYRHGSITIPQTTLGEPLAIELNHFIDCVTNNTKSRTNGSHGARIINLIEKANKQYEK